MKNFDNLKMPKLIEEIMRMRAETEAMRAETEAIRKQGEEAHIQRKAEIDATRAETEAIRKQGEEAHNQRIAEIDAIRKEAEANKIKGEAELLALKKESEKADEKLKSTMDRLGFNVGKGIENMFFQSILSNPTLNNIHFDIVNNNVKLYNESGATATEIDLVLVNKTSVGLVETKHRFRKEDLEKFLSHSYPMFKKYGGNLLCTHIYLFIAAASYDDDVVQLAKNQGVGVLHLKNNLIEVEGNLKMY